MPRIAPARDITAGQYHRGLIGAYGLHLLILALYVLSVIPQEFHPPEHLFLFHNGGDNQYYLALARDLAAGDLSQPNKYPLGFPILLVPFVILFPGRDSIALTQIVAAFWSVLMFPIGQWTLGWITRQLTGRRWLALGTVMLWTVLPLIFWAALRLVSSPIAAETGSVHLLWAQMLSDGPATLVTLLAFATYLMLRRQPERLRWPLLLGLLSGYLVLMRFTGVLTGAVLGALLLLERRWRAATLMAGLAALVTLPQLLYNAHFFGSPLTTGYTALDPAVPGGLFSLGYLVDALEKMWARAGIGLPLAAGAALLVVGLGLSCFWRRERWSALALAGWIAGYLALYAVYYYSWTGGILRFWIPLYPALVLTSAGALQAVLARLRL